MVQPAAAVLCRVSILVAGDLGAGWDLSETEPPTVNHVLQGLTDQMF